MIVPGRTIEQTLRQQGFAVVAGIDEVGRGAWAGPVVAAAVILPDEVNLGMVKDSKVLSASKRREIDRQIRRQAIGVGVGWVSAVEVDVIGLTRAVALSGWRALLSARLATDAIILDGKAAYLQTEFHTIVEVKADATELSVAAASIVAKVARDRYMQILARHFPQYGFEQHVGYGTAAHLSALQKYGSCAAHRQSYKPIQRLTHVG